MLYEFSVFNRTGYSKQSKGGPIRLQARTGGWNEANTTLLLQRRLILWQGGVDVVSVPCAFWILTIFTSFEFIVV